MSKAPRLPQKEQEQAKEPSSPRIQSPTPRSLPIYSTEFDRPQTDHYNTHRHNKLKPIQAPLNSQVNSVPMPGPMPGPKPIVRLNPPSMNFNAATPTLNTDLPRPPPQFSPPAMSRPLPKNLSVGGHHDEFKDNELLVDRYQVTKKIGQGGMGQVFSAVDQRLNREVVVKVAYSGGEGPSLEDRARFEREALKMASLNHPNIVTIYDRGEHQGDQFLVMELIKGETLKSFVSRSDSLTVHLFKDIVTQLLRGVQEAHEHDVIHRDLKPSNLMWDGQRKVLKILDFGLARGVEGDTVTGTGHVHGSIQYMAPEQIRGEAQGPATDIYAIGILCFQLISKTLPFRGENTVELMFQKLQKDPFSLLEQEKTPNWVTPALAQVIRSCLNLKPSERPLTADDCLDQILASLPGTKTLSRGRTSPFLYDPKGIADVSPIESNEKKHERGSTQKNYKLLLSSALLGALLLQLIIAFFTGTGFNDDSINPNLNKPASVYFTSIDHLSNSDSQVTLSVDGEEQGLTPLKLELTPGEHEVTLSQGEWRFTKSYDLKSGESYWYALPAPSELNFKLPAPINKTAQSGNIKKELSSANPVEIPVKKKKAKRNYRRQNKAYKKAKARAKENRRRTKNRNKTPYFESARKRQPRKAKPKKSTAIDVPLLELE